jgi:hypothetical protein
MENPSLREERIRKITHLYYSKPEIQKAIFDFASHREISPRYFEGFGKRPDSLEYQGDVFELVKKGATSFHGSEEIWENPLNIQTGMKEADLNKLRIGWDLLLDIDSKYIDYSKIMAKIIINFLEFSGVKNVGIKFSGSKGFHIIIPWKSFPKEINNVKTSDMFPEWPRILTKYIMAKTKKELTEKIMESSYKEKYGGVSKYIKREGGSEEIAGGAGENKIRFGNNIIDNSINNKINLNTKFENILNKRESYNEQVLPDLILVSPRHLFRMPYSLHEKTALASVVLDKNKIMDFQPRDADPFKIEEVKNFTPHCREGEATQLLMQALDWNKESSPTEEKKTFEFKPINITDRSEKNFPPCIKQILLGINDGKKRAVFALINFFRSIGTEKDELEKILYSWNEKNKPPLQTGYIKSQISWALRKKPIMPPNCREFYQGVGTCSPDTLCNLIKNPVNYVVKKNFQSNNYKSPKNKDNFKNNN